MTNDFDHEAFLKLNSDYKIIEKFIAKHENIDYIKFDYSIVNDVSLFAIDPDFDFNQLAGIINKIVKTMPAMIHIFSKPLLHLTEQEIILPVDAVKLVDKNTIQHAATHSEVWETLEQDSIKPYKLLTKIYQDNYSIYENLVFCDTVDKVLLFARYNIRLLKDLILTNQSIEMNLLERVNHLNHFLALGKLHTGYIRFFDKYYDIAQEELNNLDHIYNQLIKQLRHPIYKKNIKRPKQLQVRKTNILAMHKFYRQIYALNKFLEQKQVDISHKDQVIDLPLLKSNYFNFCQILLLFAVGHFNFSISSKINFSKLSVLALFKNWRLTIRARTINRWRIITLQIVKDKTYKVVLIPMIDNIHINEKSAQNMIDIIKEKTGADQCIICNPQDYEQYLNYECFISISNIDSFRRFQQILLQMMINADSTRDQCPFCSNKINNISSHIPEETTYVCKSCRTVITDAICPTMDKPYSYTGILNLRPQNISRNDFRKHDSWLYYRKLETQMFYRNITQLDNMLGIICPHCNSVHRTSHYKK